MKTKSKASKLAIVLFYKRLIEPGGAERLLLREYDEFIRLGHQVNIVTYQCESAALFDHPTAQADLVELSGSSVHSFRQLVQYLRQHREALILCSSGHIDIYLAARLARVKYALHIHHPAFMSFNDTDKYSLPLRKHIFLHLICL